MNITAKHNAFLILSGVLLILNGCCSNNVKSFHVDPQLEYHLKTNKFSNTYIINVKKPEGDTSSLMCRMAGNIYLPGKMTYSQYVRDAFSKSMRKLGILANERSAAKHVIEITLGKISLDTIGGKWKIAAHISIDSHEPVKVQTIYELRTKSDRFFL